MIATGWSSVCWNLGIEPFLVASSLAGIVAQRMVRRICPECARPV
jgi:type II secretory ATPase GspE/PulE/Tfp pilus assembly ATPase PilB-like protein